MSLGLQDLPNARTLDPSVRHALDAAQQVFSPYTRDGLDPGWKSFWQPGEQAMIESQPVSELSQDLMGFVLANVVTVHGNATDLKYFLTRLLELAVTRPFQEHLTLVASIVRKADFNRWPQEEQMAIQQFMRSWWRQALAEEVNVNAWPVEDALCAAVLLFDDVGPFLRMWEADTSLNATLHAMNTVRLHLGAERDEFTLGEFWVERLEQAGAVRGWLLGEAILKRLEEAMERVGEEPARTLLKETAQRLGRVRSTSTNQP